MQTANVETPGQIKSVRNGIELFPHQGSAEANATHFSHPNRVVLLIHGFTATDLPPTAVPAELRKSWVARLIDLRGG